MADDSKKSSSSDFTGIVAGLGAGAIAGGIIGSLLGPEGTVVGAELGEEATVAGEAAEVGAAEEAAVAKKGGLLNKIIQGGEIYEIGKTVRSLFGKSQKDDDKQDKDSNNGISQAQTSGTYAGSTSQNSNADIDSVDRQIAKQESLLTSGFWFGKNKKPDQHQIDDALKGNVAGFVAAKLVLIDNKISRLDERMLGITKILREHLVLERERLAELEIGQEERGLKLSSGLGMNGIYNKAMGNAKAFGSNMLDALLPFLLVGLSQLTKDLFDKISKWTWAQMDRFIAGVSVASRYLIKAMDGISAFATRTKNTLLGKLRPFGGSSSTVSQVSEEEKDLRLLFDTYYKQNRGEFGQGAKQATKSAQRSLLKGWVSKDPKKYNEAFKSMFSDKRSYELGVPVAPAEDKVLIEEADNMSVRLAKFAGRASIKLSAKATRLLSYLIPLRKILAPIAKYAKFLVFLDPLIALLKCGGGPADIAEVKTSFVRAFGAFIGAELGAWGGAAGGAVLGGILGSFFPIIGNIFGAAAGGIIGGLVGGFGGASAGEWIAEKLWQLMGGEKTPADVQADAIAESKNKTDQAANNISNATQSVERGALAAASAFNPIGTANAAEVPPGTNGGGEGKPVREGNPYDVVFGFGRYGTPDSLYKKKLSQMTIAEVNDFQLKVLRKNAPHGSTPVGGYQIINSTLVGQAKEVFGDKWKSTIFNKENQDKLAQHLFNQTNAKGRSSAGWSGPNEAGLTNWNKNTARSLRRAETGMDEKGSSPRYTQQMSHNETMPSPMPLKQTRLIQSQQYGIPSPFASTTYEDRVSVFFNANEPMMGVGMAT